MPQPKTSHICHISHLLYLFVSCCDSRDPILGSTKFFFVLAHSANTDIQPLFLARKMASALNFPFKFEFSSLISALTDFLQTERDQGNTGNSKHHIGDQKFFSYPTHLGSPLSNLGKLLPKWLHSSSTVSLFLL